MTKLTEEKLTTKRKRIGYSEIVFTSYGGMDTSVRIGGSLICTIAGNEIDQFMNELEQVISKYRI
jgi:hypothetical protein